MGILGLCITDTSQFELKNREGNTHSIGKFHKKAIEEEKTLTSKFLLLLQKVSLQIFALYSVQRSVVKPRTELWEQGRKYEKKKKKGSWTGYIYKFSKFRGRKQKNIWHLCPLTYHFLITYFLYFNFDNLKAKFVKLL